MQEANKKEKLTVDDKYIRPTNAEKLLKTAMADRQTVYISGSTGFGKTSLVANFLSRRRYEYFTASDIEKMENGLRKICENNSKEDIIVIDDLYLVDTPEVREILYELLQKLMNRFDIWLILISRADLPGWLKPLYVQNIFVLIGESHLAFTQKEEDEYIESWGLNPISETRNEIRRKGRGYPLFLKIIGMKFNTNNSLLSEKEIVAQAQDDYFDYVRIYVYDKWNIELQEFLMDISVVDFFDVKLAQLITKRNDAEKMILSAMEIGNFIKKYTKNDKVYYELRDAFRVSMRRQLNIKSTLTHIEELYYSAGTGYELDDDVVNALSMYEKCGREDGISRLLVSNIRKHVGVGHYWELRRYYLKLSEDVIKSSPELMTGMSLLHSILLNDEESERWYHELEKYAKENTGSARKIAQSRVLYLDIALPHRGSLKMVDILKNAGTFVKDRKNILPEFSLTNNQPSIMNGGKDFCNWSKKDKEIAGSIGKITEHILGIFGKGLVNLALAESSFEKGLDSYEVATLANQGRIQAESGGKPEQVFVSVGIISQLTLINGRVEDSMEMLDSFKSAVIKDASHLLTGIDALRVRFLLYQGKLGEIEEWMQTAPDEDKEFCTLERYRYMAKVRVYIATGKKEKAFSLLHRMITYAQKRQRVFIEIESNVLLAIVQYRMGNENYKETMQNAINGAESYHFVRVLSREGNALIEIFNSYEFSFKDNEFKEQVYLECKNMAEFYPSYLSEKMSNVIFSKKALMILKLQAEGLSINNIAEKLDMSPAGVKYYNTETYKKLGVTGKAAAITEARNRKLI